VCMKTTKILIPIIACFFFANGQAQVIPHKLAPPPERAAKPSASPKPHWVWFQGHYTWNKNAKKYFWVNGKYAKPKPDYDIIAGFWKPMPEGYKWVPSYWKLRKAHRYKLKGVKGRKTKPLFKKKEIIIIG